MQCCQFECEIVVGWKDAVEHVCNRLNVQQLSMSIALNRCRRAFDVCLSKYSFAINKTSSGTPTSAHVERMVVWLQCTLSFTMILIFF